MAQPSATTVERARQCLANAVPIPGWPLVDLVRAAAFNSQPAFEVLQNAIDYLTCKAKANTQFTDEEKAFLRAFYSDLARGGKWYMGFPEAAALMWHYLGNSGSRFQINEAVYQTSVIVRDTSEAIKDYIREQIAKKRNFDIVRTTDRTFLSSPQAHRVSQAAGRDYRMQGYLITTARNPAERNLVGYLLAEQSNLRLQKANNRFPLVAQNTMGSNNAVSTRWSVDDRYEFQPFARGDIYTELPLGSRVLKLPDGLSHYLTVLDMAKEFDYWSAWMETWNV